jgi:hypothetical protein
MRKVKGFLTSFGAFFESKEEAEYHEAIDLLETNGVDGEFIAVCNEHPELVRRYIDAFEKYTAISRGTTDDGEAEEGLKTLLEFEASRPKPMSNVGGG